MYADEQYINMQYANRIPELFHILTFKFNGNNQLSMNRIL